MRGVGRVGEGRVGQVREGYKRGLYSWVFVRLSDLQCRRESIMSYY